jgi:hypothetical protein
VHISPGANAVVTVLATETSTVVRSTTEMELSETCHAACVYIVPIIHDAAFMWTETEMKAYSGFVHGCIQRIQPCGFGKASLAFVKTQEPKRSSPLEAVIESTSSVIVIHQENQDMWAAEIDGWAEIALFDSSRWPPAKLHCARGYQF